MSRARRVRRRDLDGLRGLAALSVLFQHVFLFGLTLPGQARHLTVPQIGGIIRWSLIAVCVFFALSGYLLIPPFVRAWQSGSSLDGRLFLKRRTARLLPMLWLAGALMAFVILLEGGSPSIAQLVEHASLTLIYFGSPPLLPVAWTLCVEFVFYGLLVVLFTLCRRLSRGRAVGLIVAVVACLFALSALLRLVGLPQAAARRLGGPGIFFPVFVLGGCAALCPRPTTSTRVLAALVGAVSLVILAVGPQRLVAPLFVEHERLWYLGAGAGAAVFLWAIPAMNSRVLAGLGLISYSLYLLHVPVMRLIALIAAPAPNLVSAGVYTAIVLAVTIMLSVITYRTVEIGLTDKVTSWLDARIRTAEAFEFTADGNRQTKSALRTPTMSHHARDTAGAKAGHPQ